MKAVCPINPVRLRLEDIVDNTVTIEDDGEDHTDGDGIGDIGKEEDGLKEFLEEGKGI